jgi:hypothetical protein
MVFSDPRSFLRGSPILLIRTELHCARLCGDANGDPKNGQGAPQFNPAQAVRVDEPVPIEPAAMVDRR